MKIAELKKILDTCPDDASIMLRVATCDGEDTRAWISALRRVGIPTAGPKNNKIVLFSSE